MYDPLSEKLRVAEESYRHAVAVDYIRILTSSDTSDADIVRLQEIMHSRNIGCADVANHSRILFQMHAAHTLGAVHGWLWPRPITRLPG